jgi:hypothetical protein
MKKNAFSALDILISALLTIAVFFVCLSAFNHLKLKTGDGDEQTLKQHIDNQVSEIEEIKKQSEQFQKDMLKDFE